MKQYMIVYTAEGEQGVTFADHWSEATQKAMDIECGLGGYAEIYGRNTHEDEDLPPEYELIQG